MSVERRRPMIEPGHPALSVVRQCELVSISRSGFDYQPAGETALNLALMRLIDAQFLTRSSWRPLRWHSIGGGAETSASSAVVWRAADGAPAAARATKWAATGSGG